MAINEKYAGTGAGAHALTLEPDPDILLPPRRAAPWQGVAMDDLVRSAGELASRMGIEISELGARRAVARMPVAGNTQPYGMLHGGASVLLAESVGSVAANVHAGPDHAALGLEISATHHRAVRHGHVHAEAVALHLGRRVASYEIAITDDEGRRVCSARLTCMIVPRPEPTPAT